MNVNYEKLMKCFECVQQKITFKPEIALILGSGLGDYADTMEVVETLDYHDIEGFPVSTVPGHKGRFVFGYAGGVPIVAMQGRVHFYEGYKPQDVVLPIRLMKLMGAKVLFLTNAAGGINRSFNAGDFMLITDQISMSVPSPLHRGEYRRTGRALPGYVRGIQPPPAEDYREFRRDRRSTAPQGRVYSDHRSAVRDPRRDTRI